MPSEMVPIETGLADLQVSVARTASTPRRRCFCTPTGNVARAAIRARMSARAASHCWSSAPACDRGATACSSLNSLSPKQANIDSSSSLTRAHGGIDASAFVAVEVANEAGARQAHL